MMLLYCSGKTVQVPELHCDHTEADTWLFLNSMHAAKKYSNTFLSDADSNVFELVFFWPKSYQLPFIWSMVSTK